MSVYGGSGGPVREAPCFSPSPFADIDLAFFGSATDTVDGAIRSAIQGSAVMLFSGNVISCTTRFPGILSSRLGASARYVTFTSIFAFENRWPAAGENVRLGSTGHSNLQGVQLHSVITRKLYYQMTSVSVIEITSTFSGVQVTRTNMHMG